MHIGNRIRKLREDKKMLQKDIAQATGLSNGYISDLEKSESCPTATLELICKALGITPSEFFSDESFYIQSEYQILKNDKLTDLIKEIGIEYLVLSKELKDQKITPEELRKTLEALKSLGLIEKS